MSIFLTRANAWSVAKQSTWVMVSSSEVCIDAMKSLVIVEALLLLPRMSASHG